MESFAAIAERLDLSKATSTTLTPRTCVSRAMHSLYFLRVSAGPPNCTPRDHLKKEHKFLEPQWLYGINHGVLMGCATCAGISVYGARREAVRKNYLLC